MQMIAPRDIYDLADTVDAEQLAQEGADLEQVNKLFVMFFNVKHLRQSVTSRSRGFPFPGNKLVL